MLFMTKKEGSELSEKIGQLKTAAEDGSYCSQCKANS